MMSTTDNFSSEKRRMPSEVTLQPGQVCGFGDLVERLERLERAVALMMNAPKNRVKQSGGEGRLFPLEPFPTPVQIGRVLKLSRPGVARFIHAMMQARGEVIPDDECCRFINCTGNSLKVFACEARSALTDLGFRRAIIRSRGNGYSMSVEPARRILEMCKTSGLEFRQGPER